MAIYLNDELVEKIPESAMRTMAERLSFVVSTYFSNHPDEYVRFLEGQERRRKEEMEKKKGRALHQSPAATATSRRETKKEKRPAKA